MIKRIANEGLHEQFIVLPPVGKSVLLTIIGLAIWFWINLFMVITVPRLWKQSPAGLWSGDRLSNTVCMLETLRQ